MGNSNKILYYLSQRKNWVKASELSNYLSISERQIRKYISAINQQYQMILSGPQGYKLDKKQYELFISVQKNTPNEQENRRRYILQKLIVHSQGYDLFDFADELYVSEATIKKDLQTIRPLLKKYKLSITRTKNILQLSGHEEAMRKLMYSFISDYSFNTLFTQEHFLLSDAHSDYHDIQLKLKEILEQHHLSCSDFALNNLTMHLIIILIRVENGNQLSNDEHLDYRNSDSYQVALTINQYFMEAYHICFNHSELINISFIIDHNINRVGNIQYDYLNQQTLHQYVDPKYIQITKDIIERVEENYYLFPFKENFISKFTLHIQNLFFRSQHNFSVKNPLTNTIKMTYPLIYDIAVFIAQELELKHHILLNEDEIAFISFHIGAYFEENSFTKMTRVNCAFIYIDYYDFYKTTLAKINQRFDDRIAITHVLPISRYVDEISPDTDLLILPLGIQSQFKTRTISIKPFLNEEDFDHLEKVIDDISFMKQRDELKDYILNFFNEQLFYKNPPFKDKNEALLHMTKDLYHLGYTSIGFYDDVLNRESLSSTAFHDIAVPHSLTTKNAHKSFISIALFNQGILWSENKTVHVVALIGINDHSRKIFSKFFDQIIQMFDHPSNIQSLLSSQNFEAFFNILESFFSSED